MPTYLYGLILSRNADRAPLSDAGIDGTPVRVVRCDGVSAVVGSLGAPPSREDKYAVAAHDIALTKVVRHAVTVLSSRFGQMFADDHALCRELASSAMRERIVATLERLDGYGEMRIVMRDVIAPPSALRASVEPQDSPGRAYLESLRRTLQPRRPIDFRATLGDLVLDERVERRKDVQTISHLVRFGDESKYRAELYSHPVLEGATILGPHALYTFAEPG